MWEGWEKGRGTQLYVIVELLQGRKVQMWKSRAYTCLHSHSKVGLIEFLQGSMTEVVAHHAWRNWVYSYVVTPVSKMQY